MRTRLTVPADLCAAKCLLIECLVQYSAHLNPSYQNDALPKQLRVVMTVIVVACNLTMIVCGIASAALNVKEQISSFVSVPQVRLVLGVHRAAMFLVQTAVAVATVIAFLIVRKRVVDSFSVLSDVNRLGADRLIQAALSRVHRVGWASALVLVVLLARGIQDLLSSVSYLRDPEAEESFEKKLELQGWPVPLIVFFATTLSGAACIYSVASHDAAHPKNSELREPMMIKVASHTRLASVEGELERDTRRIERGRSDVSDDDL